MDIPTTCVYLFWAQYTRALLIIAVPVEKGVYGKKLNYHEKLISVLLNNVVIMSAI